MIADRPKRSRERTVEVLLSVNPVVIGSWHAATLRTATFFVKNGRQPDPRFRAELIQIQLTTQSPTLYDLIEDALFWMGEDSHG